MDDDLKFRQARDGEGSSLADLWLRSRAAAIAYIPAPVHDAEDVRRWFVETVVPKFDTWVAESSGCVIVGLLVLNDGWLEQLYLEPGWTGLGIGSHLVEIAKTRYPHRLDLRVFQSNRRARKFYERHGFFLVGTTDGDNEEGAPDAHYAWEPAPGCLST